MQSSHPTSAQVLLVDDQPEQVEMYRYTLEDAGFVVYSANTGADAVASARDVGPDLIVLDVRLPDMTGWDVCALLQTDTRTERIPVLILTAAVSPTLQADVARTGCAGHLLKPCYPSQLTDAIRAILAAA
jgi:CheY-like chemotaxis protein